jgi:peptidoglycan/xylan/chitin deacetylase (PgdA/CDA1 family)
MPRLHPRTTRPRAIGTAIALTMGALIPGVVTSPASAASTSGTASGRAAAASGATVSFTFDDGRTSQYLNAVPLLDAASMKGTFFIISDALTWGPSYLTAGQVRALAAAGHEIGNHTQTHADLSELSVSQVRAEFQKSQAKISSVAGRTPLSCAYPYGATDPTVESVAAEFFRGCRSTDGGMNKRTTDRYRLRTYYVHTSTTAAQIRAAVERATADKAWLILCYHGVGKVSSSDDVSRDTFATHVQAVKASGVKVRTVAQALT